MRATILMLCYNHERYLEQCLNSIFNQTHTDIEIIFLDNVSTDGSYGRAEGLLAASGVRHKLFRNDVSKPITENLNFLLEHVTGDYLFPFSSDDWMAPDNVKEKVALLQQKPEVGLVFGGGWWYFEDTNQYIEADISKFKKGDMSRNLLLDKDSYFWCGPAYPTPAVREAGGWDEALAIEDLDLNLRIALKYQVDFVPKSLVYYRRHSSAFTSNYKLMVQGFRQYYEKYKHHPALPIDHWMSDNYNYMAYQASAAGNYGDTLRFLISSYSLHSGRRVFKLWWPCTKVYLFTLKPVRWIWDKIKRGNN